MAYVTAVDGNAVSVMLLSLCDAGVQVCGTGREGCTAGEGNKLERQAIS